MCRTDVSTPEKVGVTGTQTHLDHIPIELADDALDVFLIAAVGLLYQLDSTP